VPVAIENLYFGIGIVIGELRNQNQENSIKKLESGKQNQEIRIGKIESGNQNRESRIKKSDSGQ